MIKIYIKHYPEKISFPWSLHVLSTYGEVGCIEYGFQNYSFARKTYLQVKKEYIDLGYQVE